MAAEDSKGGDMSARLVNCPDCGRKVSKMALACPACGRPLSGDDYDECGPPGWPLRLLFSILSPLLAVGGFLITVGEALLGFGLLIGGLVALPTHPVLGGALIAFGVGIFLLMIKKGIKAAFEGRVIFSGWELDGWWVVRPCTWKNWISPQSEGKN